MTECIFRGRGFKVDEFKKLVTIVIWKAEAILSKDLLRLSCSIIYGYIEALSPQQSIISIIPNSTGSSLR
jgi:hypothetical protein